MPHDKLLINTVLLTVFIIIVDHMFIHNHITLNQSLAEQHIDNTDIKIMEQQLEDEIRKEDKMIEKMKKKKKIMLMSGQIKEIFIKLSITKNLQHSYHLKRWINQKLDSMR